MYAEKQILHCKFYVQIFGVLRLQHFGLQSTASRIRKLNVPESERVKAPALEQRNREIPQTQWSVT